MSQDVAKSKIEPWLAPVTDANPAGDDARYDPLHEEIRSEAAKLDSPSGGLPDWAKLVKLAHQLTTTKSKDLLIEAYAAYGMYNVDGLMGLASGVYLLAESMDRFWDVMQPPAKRVRARVNAIQWLTDKLETTLPETQVGASDISAVVALDAAVKRLRSVVADKFQDQAPALRPLADAVERLKLSLPEGSSAEPARDTEPPPPSPTTTAPPEAKATEATPPSPQAESPTAAPPQSEVNHEAVLAEHARPFVEPIPGAAPAGTDAKYDPEHEELRNLVAALDSPTGGVIDWAKATPRAGKILKEKSKDLLIASYLAWGMWETGRFHGLAVGLEVITQICERYWETCFPPAARLRGRANALSWLLERLEKPLPEAALSAADKTAIEMLDVAAKRFASVVREKFEDAAPRVRPLLDNVQRLRMSVPEPAAPPPPKREPAPPPPAPPRPATQPAPTASSAPAAATLGAAPAAVLADPKEVGKFAGALGKSLVDAAKVLRDAAPADPTSYTFLRLGLALGFTLPPAQGTETKVPPPIEQVVKDIEVSISKQAWDQVLTKSELALTAKRHWLDLHRFTALALTNLGAPYAKARDAVVAGTAFWVKSYPDLLEFTFAGGMPFASAATREWIQSEVMPSAAGASGGSGDSSEGADILAKARSLTAGGKTDEALAVLDTLANGARSGRARFRAKLAMAQALATGQTAPAAEGIFSALLEEIDAVGLERWEPELAAECYRSHLGCLKQLKKPNDPTVPQQTVLVYRRLCRVDPLAALKVGI
jgi:type VI secretion system protein VasJ